MVNFLSCIALFNTKPLASNIRKLELVKLHTTYKFIIITFDCWIKTSNCYILKTENTKI